MSDDIQEGMWRCKDGRVIPIVKMSDQHLLNTIALLERKGLQELPDIDFGLLANPFDSDTHAYDAAEQEIAYYLENPPMKPNPKYQELVLERKARKLPQH